MSRFTVKGQQGFYGKFLPKMLKRDLMYMEDRWVMKQKVCLKRFRPGNFFGKHSLSNNIGWETFCYSKCIKKFPTLEHGEPVQPLRVRFAHIKETEQSIFQQMEDIILE